MSLDVAGPFQPGVDQAAGAAPRYFLVANVSIPVNASGPMVQGLQDLGFRVKPPSQEEAVNGEQDEGIPSEEAPLDDPMSELDETVEEGDIPVVEAKHRAAAEQRWKEFLTEGCEAESRVLTFAVPLVSRNSHQVVEKVAWIYARVRSMNIPILRLHTDRAREFASSSFARWCSNRDILHTMSPGDEPTQNARVERTRPFEKPSSHFDQGVWSVHHMVAASTTTCGRMHVEKSVVAARHRDSDNSRIRCSSGSQVQDVASSWGSLEVSWCFGPCVGASFRHESYIRWGVGPR